MYLDAKIGKHGEIVIPSFVRKKFKLKKGEHVKLNVTDDGFEVMTKHGGIADKMRATAKKEGVPKQKILMGDELYEEVF